MSRYLPQVLIFLLGGGIGYIIGINPLSTNPGEPAEGTKPEPVVVENSPVSTPVVPVKDILPLEPLRVAKPTSPIPVTVDCISKDEDMSLTLNLFSEKLEKDSIWYSQKNPKELRDCSGIFFRVMNEIKTNCGNYIYPDPNTTRSSRGIARWYYDNANLSIVHDPMHSRDLIEPGAVMFFGKSGAKYNNLTIDLLSGSNEKKGEITHMGIVTEVTKDKDGKVKGYVMMHGHRPGKLAHRTHYHSIEPPRLNYPILGNWNQQWVAVANIMTPLPQESDKPKRALEKPAEPRPEIAGDIQALENTPTAIAKLTPTLDCFTTDKLSNALTSYSQSLERKKIMYSQAKPEELRDCSGIFFRMTNFVKENCTRYEYPDPKLTRNTKTLSRWFYNKGNLLIVNDAEKSLSEIRPGTVMFFGQWNKKYAKLNIDVITSSKGIQHMGVVTEIVKNDAGEPVGYWMMHGRSKGKIAKRTLHMKNPKPGTSGLGHWKQQLVAIANIMTPKSEDV